MEQLQQQHEAQLQELARRHEAERCELERRQQEQKHEVATRTPRENEYIQRLGELLTRQAREASACDQGVFTCDMVNIGGGRSMNRRDYVTSQLHERHAQERAALEEEFKDVASVALRSSRIHMDHGSVDGLRFYVAAMDQLQAAPTPFGFRATR